MAKRIVGWAELRGWVDREIGVTDWITIDQARITAFADVTDDHQYIHVDPERARSSPFGTTIAHGFLTLSLLSRMSYEAVPEVEGVVAQLNYGFNKVRFVTPVKSGERIRGRFVLKQIEERAPKQMAVTHDVTVEIEGAARPALVAQWLSVYVLA
ncbi:MAG TPA: MaoC family dehydratase [Steroidobacteraceae bacterium]|nr:MaoC family dehydratase [Steroidobacteraceae bacterium]